MSIVPSRANAYTGNPLDRMDARRGDEGWVAARLADPGSLFVPVWRGRTLFTGLDEGAAEGGPGARFLSAPEAEAMRQADYPWSLLGVREDGRAMFAFDLSTVEDAGKLVPEGGAARFEDLRALAGLLRPDEAAIVAQARGLMHWRVRHRFCGVCGSACHARNAGYAMSCTGCGTQHFPRTDPAVIMLVHRNGRALLGHSTRFPSSTMYSTLAGFVEPGESLEEAVAREVLEESGVRVGRVSYHSSQPWPFPSSIMLGFHAEGISEEITVDPAELRDARWFTREELRDSGAHGFSLPRADSIARRLIEDWMEQG